MSDRATKHIQNRFLSAAVVCIVLLTTGYLTFVNTAWGHRVDENAYFTGKAFGQSVAPVNLALLGHVSTGPMLFAAAVLLAIAAVRRCALVGLLTVMGFGGAVAGAEVLKNVLPWQALVPGDAALERGLQADTYPSGHVTVGTAFALSLLLVSSSRWRPWLAVAGGCLSAAFATGVLFAGWHRPSDSLGALIWSGLCTAVIAALAVRLCGRPSRFVAHGGGAVFASTAIALLSGAATWAFVAAQGTSDHPGAAPSFLVLSGLIIAGAFSLTAWYGWQLRAVDWPAERSPAKPS